MALLAADAVSTIGDQLARIALAVLVYNRSNSALLSAATLAASYLPWVVAAPFLSGLGDRYDRRTVLSLSDLFRALIAACLAIPQLSTAGVIALIFVLTCADPPFSSAKSALVADVLHEKSYAVGQSFQLGTSYIFQFLGFAIAGGTVSLLGVRPTMIVDAGTFIVSAAIIRLCLRHRGHPEPTAKPEALRGGWPIVFRNPAARWSLGLGASLIALDTVTIGVAIPWSAQLGFGPALAGMLIAASVVGAAAGQTLLLQVSAATRSRLVIPLAVLTFAVLALLFQVRTPIASALVIFVSGMASSFQVVINQLFVLSMPASSRARAFGVAGTLINLGQGAAILGAGAVADKVLPSDIVGCTGLIGVLVALLFGIFRPAGAGVPPAGLTPKE